MKNIHKHKAILEVLEKADPKFRTQLLKNAPDSVICILVEIIHNVLQGHIKISPHQKKHLSKFRTSLRKLTKDCITRHKRVVKSKARKSINQVGGALPFLIPLIAPLIAKAALSGAIATGTGLAVQKLVGK